MASAKPHLPTHRLAQDGTKVRADASLGSLRALGGVSKYPIRVKCASLAWHAMKAAMQGEGGAPVSTE